ncbi:MAG: hypothetical protein ACYC4L_13230 [Chloroflexota bacterium]
MSSKWEREIEELLRDKFEERGRGLPRRDGRPPKRGPSGGNWRRWLQSLSPERLLLYGLGLALVAYLLRGFGGGAGFLVALASIIMITASIVLSVRHRERPYVEKRWRGQVIHLPRRQSWWVYQWQAARNRINRWLTRR